MMRACGTASLMHSEEANSAGRSKLPSYPPKTAILVETMFFGASNTQKKDTTIFEAAQFLVDTSVALHLLSSWT
jgi:hypothetical protein